MKTYEEARAVAKLCWELDVETRWYADWTKDDELKCTVDCSDFLFWATADGTDVEAGDLPLLQSCYDDLKHFGCEYLAGLLFCARKAGMRPQGAYYKHLKKESWTLFNACGPVREPMFGNPVAAPGVTLT